MWLGGSTRRARPIRVWVLAALGFAGVAILQSWPLPLHLSTRLTGSPTGDTGVYVWNTWVFRHELVDGHRSPLSTLTVLPLDGPTDLSLHNYTVFSDLLVVPLQPWIGVVAAFNVVYLVNVALAGFGMFLLAKRVTGRAIESWLAGLLFAWSPFLVARGGEHFSLAAAAPLPLFLYWFDRAWERQWLREAVAAGACVAWAAGCDPYYAVYCVMLAACVVFARVLAFQSSHRPAADLRRPRRCVDAAIAALVALIVIVRLVGGGVLRIGPLAISMQTLYTPTLALSILGLVRLLLTIRLRVARRAAPPLLPLLRAAAAATVVAAIALAPELYAMGVRVLHGNMVSAPVLWRSSAPGVDLLAFFVPNPNHPLAPRTLVDWVTRQPGGFTEQVASLSLVALAVILIAWRRAGFRPGRFWVGITIGFAALTLGPFVRVGGMDTFVPTPWALLRYLPVIGAARMPPRFGIVVILGLSVLFAGALAALARRHERRRHVLLATVGLALVLELCPAPRTLYSAEIPAVFRTIAADPRPVRVLELPFGIRDGLSGLGDFNAASQFHQTFHGKELVGGYLSRVTQSCKNFYRRLPVVNALLVLSEGRNLTPGQRARADEASDDFLRRARLGYVVMDQARVSAALRSFAVDVLGLTKIGESDGYDLYVPAPPPIR
jgi:hypothetical protein